MGGQGDPYGLLRNPRCFDSATDSGSTPLTHARQRHQSAFALGNRIEAPSRRHEEETTLLVRGPDEAGWHTPEISSWTAEASLRDLLTSSPQLIPGAGDATLVAVEELWVPSVGPVDVAAVSDNGRIWLVECKLRDNPEIRRHVVGQLLAYASGLWRLSYEEFDSLFATRAKSSLAESIETLHATDWDEEEFRTQVANNLAAGRFTLVFAVDHITDELKKIVEYLNEHTGNEVQILALELQHLKDGPFEVLVPRIYGEESASTKQAPGQQWNEQRLMTVIDERVQDAAAVQAFGRILDHAKRDGINLIYGSGTVSGSVTAWFNIEGTEAPVWTCYSNVSRTWLEFQFRWLRLKAISEARIGQFAADLRAIPGGAERLVGLEEADFMKQPSFSFDPFMTVVESAAAMGQAIERITA